MNSDDEENIHSNEEDNSNKKIRNHMNKNSSKDYTGKYTYEPSFPTSNFSKTIGSNEINYNAKFSSNEIFTEPEYNHKNKINTAKAENLNNVNNQLSKNINQNKGRDGKNNLETNNRLNNNDINNNSAEQEKINDDLSSNDQESKKGKKGRFNQNPMERISEVEGEDEKYTTIFDKINEEAAKNEYRLNEDNIQELIDKNITSENVKYLFHPTLFDTEESKSKFQPEINKNSRFIVSEKDRNKSSDTQRIKPQPIEVNFR